MWDGGADPAPDLGEGTGDAVWLELTALGDCALDLGELAGDCTGVGCDDCESIISSSSSPTLCALGEWIGEGENNTVCLKLEKSNRGITGG